MAVRRASCGLLLVFFVEVVLSHDKSVFGKANKFRFGLPKFGRRVLKEQKDIPDHLVTKDLALKSGLLRQCEKELEQKGKTLTVMCVGESGVGKTSLISNILTVPISKAPPPPTKHITDNEIRIKCDGIPLTATFIDTPGYGDIMQLEKSFYCIAADIDRRLEKAFRKENRRVRPDKLDRSSGVGVDAVLYFIAPHRLKKIDLNFLKIIQGRASIIPILAKADTMTEAELKTFRALVVKQLADAKIQFYKGPFAIISSPLAHVANNGNRSLSQNGREYPWGIAESENEKHSDLRALRRCLVTEGLSELHAATDKFYEEYRAKKLRYKRGFLGFIRKVTITAIQLALLNVLKKPAMDLWAEAYEIIEKRKAFGPELPNEVPAQEKPKPSKPFWAK